MHPRPKFALFAAAMFSSAIGLSQSVTLSRPDIFGDKVVFTAEGDLWIGNIKDRSAHRLTTDPGIETAAKFSPDGQTLAFTAQYEGGRDVYSMPVNGGAPNRLTFDPTASSIVQGWSRDGGSILFRSARAMPSRYTFRLFRVPQNGGQPSKVTDLEADFGTFGPNGELVYVPASWEWANWFHYKGGSADVLWQMDRSGQFTKLTDGKYVCTAPVFCGEWLYFASERDGDLNLYRMLPKTKKIEQVTFYHDGVVRYPASDGKRVVFQHGQGLAVYDPSSKTTTELQFEMPSDRLRSRSIRVAAGKHVGSVAIGPNGKRLIIESRGQILTVPSENGDIRVVENTSGTRALHPAMSSDGKRIAYVSDRTGEYEIWTCDAEGNDAKQLTSGLKGHILDLLWAPGGAYIAVADRAGKVELIDTKSGAIRLVRQAGSVGSYDGDPRFLEFSADGKLFSFLNMDESYKAGVIVHDVVANRTVQISPPTQTALSPTISPDGKFVTYLAQTPGKRKQDPLTQQSFYEGNWRVYAAPLFDSATSPFLVKSDEELATPKPGTPAAAKEIAESPNLNAAEARTFVVPIPVTEATKISSIGTRLLLQIGPNIQAFDYEKRSLSPFMSGAELIQRTPDAKKILAKGVKGPAILDAASAAPIYPAIDKILTVNLQKEWRQIFSETWRIARDFFYDPGMHGVDWNAVRVKYEARLAKVGDAADLTRLQADMISELHCGHAYVGGAPTESNQVLPMGFLGADLEPVLGSPAVKIAKLLRGDEFDRTQNSPLLEPGLAVKVGEYILAIGGEPVRADRDIQSQLIGTAGQSLAITVNDKPNLVGARVIRIKPMASEATLRYLDWVRSRIDYVKENGGTNFGYAHLSNMEDTGFNDFIKLQSANQFSTAMIYDTRYNGGGNISAEVLSYIATKPTAWFKPRDGAPWTREGTSTIGYSATICNEFNFSDGELFIESWKRMKLGPVIGKRTGGGEVGSGGGYSMIDGGKVFIPNYAAYMDGKWLIEGYGATPDIEVEQDPAAVMAGKDPQLDRAIAELKALLEKKPVVQPEHPPFKKLGG